MTDDRLMTKMRGTGMELLAWLREVAGMQGDVTQRVYQNSDPHRPADGRLQHEWMVLGREVWERAELSLHRVNEGTQPYLEGLHWTNVREFQRDIYAWLKLMHNASYKHPDTGGKVKLEQLINTLIRHLHGLSNAVEVTVMDVGSTAAAVLIRLKNYPMPYYISAQIPTRSSTSTF